MRSDIRIEKLEKMLESLGTYKVIGKDATRGIFRIEGPEKAVAEIAGENIDDWWSSYESADPRGKETALQKLSKELARKRLDFSEGAEKEFFDMRTDYLQIHEREYQKLIAQKAIGWSNENDIKDKLTYLERALAICPMPSSVLVLGCGDGELALALGRMGHQITGIDISPTAIEWARRKANDAGLICKFMEGSVLDLPFPDEAFDLVIDDHCFHCIIGNDRGRFLSEAKRVLTAKGILFIRTMCGEMPSSTPPEIRAMFDPISRCQVYKGVAGRYFGRAADILEEVSEFFTIEDSVIQKQVDGPEMLNIQLRKR